MQPLRVAICDDDINELESLRDMLSEITEQAGIQAEFFTYDNSEELLQIISDNGFAFDMLFLDMYIDEKLGVDIARAVRAENKRCVIIFITAFADRMADCFNFRASAYLLKPVDRDKLTGAFSIGLSHLGGDDFFCIETKDVKRTVPYDEICYFESHLKSVRLFVVNQTEPIVINSKLDDLILPGQFFHRCHASFIVNYTNVKMMKKDTHEFIMSSGTRVPISRKFYTQMSADFMRFHSVARSL